MLPVRISFDPDLPVVASQAFDTGGRSFKDGEPFPWRELGLGVDTLNALWRSNFVRCVAETPANAKTMTALVTPTASVVVPTPKQQRSARK